jgi:hypothetical protein
MKPSGIWHQVRQTTRHLGVGALAGRVARRSLRPYWTSLFFLERDLLAQLPEIVPSIPLVIRTMSPDELPSFRGVFEANDVASDEVERRFAQGDECAVALCEGRLVHFQWITTVSAWVPELRATLIVVPGEQYGYNAVTVRDARGRGILPAVSRFGMQLGRLAGRRRHRSYVRAENYPSRRGLSKIERQDMATIRRLELRRRRGALITGLHHPGAPRLVFPHDTRVWSLGRFGLWVKVVKT